MKGQSEAGKLIYQYTYNKNVSITELAASMKISYAHLSNMLRGNKRINNNQLQKICNILNLNREERAKLREAVFISNPSIIISTKDKRLYIPRSEMKSVETNDFVRLDSFLSVKNEYYNFYY